MNWNVLYPVSVTGAIAIIGLLYITNNLTLGSFGSAFLALLATFFGALFAFRLNERKDESKERSRRISAINRAILVLGAQHNEVRAIVHEVNKHPQLIPRALQMNAALPVKSLRLEQKLDELMFLFESSDPNILFELHIEQIRFDQALETVRLRAKFTGDILQPEMAKHQLKGKYVTEQMLREMLGELVFESAVNMTHTMTHHIQGSNESLPVLQSKLRALAKELFPDEKFVKFDLLEVPSQYDPRSR